MTGVGGPVLSRSSWIPPCVWHVLTGVLISKAEDRASPREGVAILCPRSGPPPCDWYVLVSEMFLSESEDWGAPVEDVSFLSRSSSTPPSDCHFFADVSIVKSEDRVVTRGWVDVLCSRSGPHCSWHFMTCVMFISEKGGEDQERVTSPLTTGTYPEQTTAGSDGPSLVSTSSLCDR